MHSHRICEATKRNILQGRIGQASESIITNAPEMASPPFEFQWKQEGSNNVEQERAIKRLVAREPPHARRPEFTGLHYAEGPQVQQSERMIPQQCRLRNLDCFQNVSDGSVIRAKSFESQELMGRACSSSRNRMPCWCAKGGLK